MKLDGKSHQELTAMMAELQSRPENQSPPGSLYLFTKACRRKTDAIARQITYNLAMARAATGDPVACDGYSGRQTNRRR